MIIAKMMALAAMVTFFAIAVSVLLTPATDASAQGNVTENVTGNYSSTGSNATAESGNISGLGVTSP
jgi:nitrogen fixation protein FixH